MATESESLFEEFCKANDINYYREIPRSNITGAKIPDYAIIIEEEPRRIIVEVKQFDPNPDDKEQSRQLNEGRVTDVREIKWRDRVRGKIHDANKQLKARSLGRYPAMLVLYDNVQVPLPLDSEDIMEAMYGNEVVDKVIWAKKEFTTKFGDNRKCTPDHNTSSSAICTLSRSGSLLCVYHNEHAKFRIDPTWLRGPNIQHYTLGPKVQGKLPDWVEL